MNEEFNADEFMELPREQKREKWASKTEYLLSCLGYAIGIGNIWRFPYLCYRSGGGAFLIPYLIMLVFCGIPLYLMETSLGQFSSNGCLTVFNIAPLFKGAGLAIIVVNTFVTIYFVTLFAYPLLFLFYSFQSKLPWAKCNNNWNTDLCIQLANRSIGSNIRENSTIAFKTSADEFFNFENGNRFSVKISIYQTNYQKTLLVEDKLEKIFIIKLMWLKLAKERLNEILHISESIEDMGGIVWPLFTCNTLAWLATYLCMSNGVKTIGKAAYVTAPFPFVILLVLLLRGLTLPGAMDGVYFYIYPQWNQLTNLKVWCDAAVQIFFSLGPGWGGIINTASYNKFSNNNKLDSIIIPLCNSGTSILAGFVIFSVLGFMSHKTGIPVSSVATGGPSLAFITYPEAISLLPWPNLWAVLFFLMLFFLGLSSVFVSIESIITSITDVLPKLRKFKMTIAFATCCLMWACSTIFTTNSGIYWLSLLDWYAASISVILISLVEVVIVGWTYGVYNFVADIEFMIQQRVSWIWLVSWKFTTPLILLAMFIITIVYNSEVTYNNRKFPRWAVDIGWASCCTSMAMIPVYMGYHLLYVAEGDLFERIRTSITPSRKWGPADLNIRVRWLREVKIKSLEKVREEYDPIHQEFLELSSCP